MNIEDTGSEFIFTNGIQTYFLNYGEQSVVVIDTKISITSKRSNELILSGQYADITLTGIAGVTNASQLATYIMNK